MQVGYSESAHKLNSKTFVQGCSCKRVEKGVMLIDAFGSSAES